ncbi:G8 domain-containing protein [Puia dinghuensis]|uniref:T9SS C-terminal target domain-containing protein n=1 Tax=Puia dinghuensis TaxID=1792502 RepID=A0A8J2UG86_9BACT|nr:G8 domain-containing protein [Puia dinghuensis]GGB11430.1 hypothetical protein GCM10011511_38790 [Puia dinghuensis]
MKTKFYLLIILALTTTNFVSARTTNKATATNGNWSSTSTWDLGRIPQNGDSIVIPAGNTVVVDMSASLNDVYITIGGALNFNQNKSLALDNASVVSILSTGMLTATHPTPNQLLSIGGVVKYDGKNDVTVAGPAVANSASGVSPTGFSSAPLTLPVTFTEFTAIRSDNGIVNITWNTVNEINNSHFDLERSTDGSEWSTITTIAAGNNLQANSYNYTDEAAPAGQIWYRIRQVDLDGNYMYTKIVLVSATANAQATIITSGKTVTIFPEKMSGSRLVVRLISLGGQVMQQQSFESASSRIDLSLSTSPNGIYLVQVTDGNQFSMVKKVMM